MNVTIVTICVVLMLSVFSRFMFYVLQVDWASARTRRADQGKDETECPPGGPERLQWLLHLVHLVVDTDRTGGVGGNPADRMLLGDVQPGATTGGERRGDLPHREHERKIPRADGRDHANGHYDATTWS